MSSSNSSAVSLLVLLVCTQTFHLPCVKAADSLRHGHGLALIQSLCRRANAYDIAIPYDLCVRTLQAAPGSSKADITGLLGITTKLALNSSAELLDETKTLMTSTGCSCKKCLGSFTATAAVLRDVDKAGVAKKLKPQLVTELNAAHDQALDCCFGENFDWFSGLLTGECDKLENLMAMAMAFTRFLTEGKHH